jgi:hypothetical protein
VDTLDREAFDALTAEWNAGDLEAFTQHLDPNIEFSPDPRWPEPGPYRGRGAVTAFLHEYRSAWGHADLEVGQVEGVSGALVARCRWLVQGAASGADVPVAFTLVLWFGSSALVERMVAFFDDDEARRWVEATASGADAP